MEEDEYEKLRRLNWQLAEMARAAYELEEMNRRELRRKLIVLYTTATLAAILIPLLLCWAAGYLG